MLFKSKYKYGCYDIRILIMYDELATWFCANPQYSTLQREKELYPYQQLLNQENSCPIVMVAHVVNHNLDRDDYLASTSKPIIKGILRDELQYKGSVISDNLLMDGVIENSRYGKTQSERLETAIIDAIQAGNDMIIVSTQTVTTTTPKEVVDIISSAVQQGKISKTRIDEAYEHVLVLKKWLREHDQQIAIN